MFVADEVLLDVSFRAARVGLTRVAEHGLLLSASADAHGRGGGGLAEVGVTGLSKLVRVQFRGLTATDDGTGIAIRWEAIGPAGGLFPVLDADVRLTPAGDQATLLALAGVYRPPLGPVGKTLDRAVLHRVAAMTIRNFLRQIAAGIASGASPAGASPAGASPVSGVSVPVPDAPET